MRWVMDNDLVRKVNERVRDDRHFTISDLSLHFPQISKTQLYEIVSSHLSYRKVCARWVPKVLTEGHKTAGCMCFDISDVLSQGRRKHVEPYCGRRRNMGAPYHTWIKTEVLALAHTGWPKRKMFKQTFSTRKITCTLFLVEFLPQGTKINSAVYCETLKKLTGVIQNKRRWMLSATTLLLHYNFRPQSDAQTQDLITSFKWEQMYHPRTALICRQVITTSSYT